MEEHEKPDSSRGPGFGFSLLYFVLHLSTIYLVAQYVVMAVEGQFHNAILPMLGVPSREGVLESAFNLLPFFSVCADCFSVSWLQRITTGQLSSFGSFRLPFLLLSSLRSHRASLRTTSLSPFTTISLENF
jgi:hypothetical protein